MNTKAIGKPSKEQKELMNEVLEYLPKTEEIKGKPIRNIRDFRREQRRKREAGRIEYGKFIFTYNDLHFTTKNELVRTMYNDLRLKAVSEWVNEILTGKEDGAYDSEALKEGFENYAEKEVSKLDSLTSTLCYENRLEILDGIMTEYYEDDIVKAVKEIVTVYRSNEVSKI